MSPARDNRKSNTHLPGAGTQPNDSIQTLSPIYPNMLVVCTASGAGFIKDVMYLRNSDNTAWLGGSGGKHTHSADTDASGGLFTDILYANQPLAYHESNMSPTLGWFRTELSSASNPTDDVAGSRLNINTGTTNGAWVNCSRSGVKLDMSRKQRLIVKMNISPVSTFATARVGVNAERVEATVSGTGSPSRYGMEFCDSAGTSRSWDVFSGDDGGNRSATNVAAADAAQGAPKAYKFEYIPGTNVKFYVSSNTASLTKSTNVPATGSILAPRALSLGIRTNNTSAKNLFLYGISFVGTISDTDFM